MEAIVILFILITLYLFLAHWSLGLVFIITIIGLLFFLDWFLNKRSKDKEQVREQKNLTFNAVLREEPANKDKEKIKPKEQVNEQKNLPFDAQLSEKHPYLRNAKIVIENDRSWHLYFHFDGPDRRYNSTSFVIHGSQMNEYILALRENFIKYNELKTTLNSKTEVRIRGIKNMIIIIGGNKEGVYLYNFYLPVKTEQQLDKMIKYLNYTKNRVEEIIASFEIECTNISS
jgi:hypothetical protein